jgi:hypothetical protein
MHPLLLPRSRLSLSLSPSFSLSLSPHLLLLVPVIVSFPMIAADGIPFSESGVTESEFVNARKNGHSLHCTSIVDVDGFINVLLSVGRNSPMMPEFIH